MIAVWATDIHLRFCDDEERAKFYRDLADMPFDALLLTGDIGGESDMAGNPEPLPHSDTLRFLAEVESAVGRPIYFVLGNHDYYRTSIASVRDHVVELCRRSRKLHFVQSDGIIALTDRTGLVGHECWGDAGWGDFLSSPVLMNDWKVIWELKQYWTYVPDLTVDLMPWALKKNDLDESALLKRLQSLGQEAAEHFRRVLPEALARFKFVVILTHVPPFVRKYPPKWRSRWEDYLPVSVCRAAGEVILEIAAQFPDRRLRILAGHIHQQQEFQVRDNITMSIGSAELMAPQVASILSLE
jgi:3',5'-cyclic-AMP phosphodiesterase